MLHTVRPKTSGAATTRRKVEFYAILVEGHLTIVGDILEEAIERPCQTGCRRQVCQHGNRAVYEPAVAGGLRGPEPRKAGAASHDHQDFARKLTSV